MQYTGKNNWGANHGAISYGHIGADLITMVDILEVREISVEERIEREEREFLDNIKTEYLIRNYGNRPVREYKKYKSKCKQIKKCIIMHL